MSGVNKVILIGRLGKDPEIKSFETGIKKANFTMATSEIRKDKDGNRTEQTEWHNVVCWRNLAEISEKFLAKGKLIYLEGKLRTRSWEDNGVRKYITEIEATTFTMLGTRAEEGEKQPTEVKITQNMEQPPMHIPPEEEAPFETDDLPF
ncbi:MAG: single-stranded DNA-binding protein [Bacteroidales bacterium]